MAPGPRRAAQIVDEAMFQHDGRAQVALAEHGLRRVAMKRAGGAGLGLPPESLDGRHGIRRAHAACQTDPPDDSVSLTPL